MFLTKKRRWLAGFFSWLLGSLFLWGVGCGEPQNKAPDPPALTEGCHPYSHETCLLPYPSSYYLQEDDKGARRIAFPDPLPITRKNGRPVSNQLFTFRDGFSPITPILVHFAERVDPETLIRSSEMARSLQPDSPIQIIDAADGARIPLFAEVDSLVKSDEAPQAVIIRPMLRLKPNTRYLVVIRDTIKTAKGGAVTQPAGFAWAKAVSAEAAKSAPAPWPRVKAMYDQDIQAATAAGLDVTTILLAWSFHTASDETLVDEMLDMREKLFAKLGADAPKYTIEKTEEPKEADEKNLYRILEGTIEVPSFLSHDEVNKNAVMLRDAAGKPKLRDQAGAFPLQIHVPRCALSRTEGVPILIFGHGLFGSAKGEMSGGYHRALAQRLCMIEIGTNWIGMSLPDATATAVPILGDLSTIETLISRLQQAQMNFLALARLALQGLAKEPLLQHEGRSLVDPQQIYYLGISNGAIQGGTLMALSPDIKRAILHVGGGGWTLLMSRSTAFGVFVEILADDLPSPVEVQLYTAFLQHFFDRVDPLTYAPYLKANPQRLGIPPKEIMYHEAIGDSLVNNLTTRLLMRTLGVPGLAPFFEPTFGIEEMPGPLSSWGYVQFGPVPANPPPDLNLPAPSNPVHQSLREEEISLRFFEQFLKPDGKIEQLCEGVCDPD